MAKPARAVISVRKPPPVDPDTFVKEGTPALKRQGAKASQRSSTTASKRHGAKPAAAQPEPAATTSTTYVRKDGVVLKRASLWLPHDVKKAVMVHAASNERDPSDVITEAICKLLGLTWPRDPARG